MRLVVATHGQLCTGFQDALSMLLGEIESIDYVSLDNRGVDDFRMRLEKCADTGQPTLILTDLIGGTPYNESYALSLAMPELVRVVTGINFPMLIEVASALDDSHSLKELARLAVTAGREGVDSDYSSTLPPSPQAKVELRHDDSQIIGEAGNRKESNMSIVLARVDDRVIHGQTTTRWMAVRPADSILVISDKIAADQLRCKVLKAAAGKLKLGIYTLAQGPAALEKARASEKKFFVISDSISNFAALKDAGADFGQVLNIGNLNGTRDGTKNLGDTVMLNDEYVTALDSLAGSGVNIQFQLLPDRDIRTWPAMKAKYQSM